MSTKPNLSAASATVTVSARGYFFQKNGGVVLILSDVQLEIVAPDDSKSGNRIVNLPVQLEILSVIFS